jgi:hypothetical protein
VTLVVEAFVIVRAERNSAAMLTACGFQVMLHREDRTRLRTGLGSKRDESARLIRPSSLVSCSISGHHGLCA